MAVTEKPSGPRFGLNRFDFRSVDGFVADVRRAEALGWDYAFIPDSQLRLRDPYVMLSFAARATERIGLGPLLANPVTRHPTVTASSIATVDELSGGRALLGLGAGDTAVRLAGLRPARVAALESAVAQIRALLSGEAINVGAPDPARLPHARPVPVWVAAGGPRTLRAAGRVADGVFIRAGTHEANIAASIDAVHAGAVEAGRDPASVRLAVVVHTLLVDDPESALLVGRSMAAGFFEYSPGLFDAPGLRWDGPPVEELKRTVRPDFHHTRDPEAAGRLLNFLPDEAAAAFCVRGTAEQVAEELSALLRRWPQFEIAVPHPMPNPPPPGTAPGPDYMERMAREVIPAVRSALAAARPGEASS